jgi:hypothetical protein
LKDRPLEDRKILEATIEQWPSDKVEAAKKAMWEADPGVGR